jgi:glyoxylase-like metal-dependent hydrolase (beta-lactamase superfamily II)
MIRQLSTVNGGRRIGDGRMKDFNGTEVSAGSPSVTAEGEALLSDARKLRYSDVAPPSAGHVSRLSARLLWTRIPLPIDLNHINVWLIEDVDGYVAIDTGMGASMCKDAWEQIEKDLFVAKPLKAIFVTHIHPDHLGLAAWLQQRHRVPVWMSSRTHETAQIIFGNAAPRGPAVEAFLRSHGADALAQMQTMFKPERFARMTSGMPEVERYVEDGEQLAWGASTWSAMRTDGHAEGHICLWCEQDNLLISGDQVLPTISPNISLMLIHGDPNPLNSYLSSLDRLRRLPVETLVLPSHGLPFYGLQHRVDDLKQHHETQLARLLESCVEPTTAYQALSVLFRRELAGMNLFLALGESIAHLEYLAYEGRMERRQEDGVTTYRA